MRGEGEAEDVPKVGGSIAISGFFLFFPLFQTKNAGFI